MDAASHFHSLEELIRALDRERKLLYALFQDRKRLSFRYNLAKELATKKDESLEFLRRFGIIHENGDFVELEDVYLKFFEEVLEVNEEINVASVKESIGSLNAAIDYYQSEKNATRKWGYLKDVKRILRNIALTTLRNVIDLKRNIDNTYKNEPTFVVKKKKLVHLDEKRKDIAALINECEMVIDKKQATFFLVAMDVELKDTVTDVKLQLKEVYHNLLELDRQIINYLNLIEYQNRLFEKVQKLKYLRDQMLLETNTDIKAKMDAKGQVQEKKGTIVLATVKGDIHDIGKNIVKVLLENYGYEVLDLGKDVPPERIVDETVRRKVRLVGLSALMTTTVPSMEETIRLLHAEVPGVKIIVGGAVLTPEYAKQIGADYYAKDAAESARIAEEVFGG